MKVVYFKRVAQDPNAFHGGLVDSSISTHCFYVPDMEIIFYAESIGGCEMDYSITEEEKFLEEARTIAEGETPTTKGIDFLLTKSFEYDDSELKKCIHAARTSAGLRKRVKSSIEQLIEKAVDKDVGLERVALKEYSEKYIVRLYDGFDKLWMDISKPVPLTDAERIWNERTDHGTKKTSFDDIDYYKIFPADTKMLRRSK
jgi:hypothetical protein